MRTIMRITMYILALLLLSLVLSACGGAPPPKVEATALAVAAGEIYPVNVR